MTDKQPVPQHLIQTASELFQTAGYAETTLSQIAAAAGLSPAQLERDFGDKERLVLALYHDLSRQTQATITDLPAGQMAQRYFNFLTGRIQQLQPLREAIAALFATAMLPHSDITAADMSPGRRDPIYQALLQVVREADDVPAGDKNVENLTMLLYVFHFLILIFWVYDRTDERKATHLLVDFMGDFLRVMRPMMVMPLFSKALTKLAQIMMLVFGGARLVADDSDGRGEES